jgi:hypothetical protein
LRGQDFKRSLKAKGAKDRVRVMLVPRMTGLPWETASVPVTVVAGSLAGGMTFEEVQREYDVTAGDIRAALRFVAELPEQESFHPLPSA